MTIVTASETPLLSVSGTTAHGTICPGTAATSQTYTITNTGTSDATGVTVLSDNAEFVVSGLSSTTIAGSGGTATYVVTFTPNSAGAKTAAITVASTTSGSNTATSSLTGTGAIAVLPSVSTSAATLVTTTTATLNASGSTFGICPNTTAKGFVISQTGLNADPLFGGIGVIDEKVSSLGTQGAFAKAITGLLSGKMYSYKSYLFDGSTYTYGAVQTFTTQAAPANDLCSNAQVLTINGPVVNGTFINSSFETPFTSGKDVWYKFTPSCDGKFTIDLVATAGQPQIYLYSVCGTSTSIQTTFGTGTTKQLTTGSLSSGIDYFIRIMAGNSAAESATFTIAVNNQISVVTQPVNQTVTSGGTATFSSSVPNNQTDRQWQVSTDGGLSFTNISGATATSYTTSATTLSMNGYQYRVVISNGTCNTVISNAATLTVNSCTPSSTSTSDYISNFATSGGMVNISNLASGYSTGGSGNFYATHYVSQYAGGAINFVENYVGGNHGFKIWVDWNKDGDFAVSEEVYTPSVSATEFNGSFTIPEGTALGDYRMRIRAVYQATGLPTINPCGTVTYGEGEDYKLTVAPTPNYVVYTDASSASATVNNTINVYLKDFDGINEFYTHDETSIYMYAWGYASNQNIYDPGTLVRFDRESTNPNVYKASVKFADLFCIPTGTNVGGIDLLFRNQYGTGGNNQTGNLYLDLTDAAVAVNAPALGTVTGITSSSATIGWNAPATGSVKGFDYYYSTSSTAPTSGTAPSGSTAANVTGATLSSLLSGTTYYYWVRSKGCDTPSGWSSEGVFSTLCLDAPVAHAVATDDITATTFLASWDAVPGASSYILEVSTSPTFGIYGTSTVAENFDGSSTPSLPSSNSPATAYTFGSGAWTIANGTKSPQSVHTPANTIQLSNNPNNSYLISPGVDNLTTVSFYARRNGTSNSVTAGINVYKVVGTTETLLKFINLPNDGNNNSNFIQYSVNVNGQNANNVKIKITQTENASHLDTFVLTSEINNPDFVAPYQKLNVGDVTSYLVDLNLLPNTQYYYRVRALNSNLCESSNSNVIPVLTKNDAVVWYSAKWSNITGPTENLNSIIRDAYHAGDPDRPSFETKNLKVESNGLLTIGKDRHVTVHGLINTVDDKIIVEDDGMLHQIGQGDNTGKITVKRNVTFTTARQQYNYMISPVKDQKMKYIFGADGSGVPYIQYVMRLNEPTNIFVNDGDGIYAQGKGYAVKEAKTSYVYNDGVAFFKGVPANGDFEYPLSNTPNRGYNLSGNPYPSNLDLTKLYEDSKNSEGGHYISSTIRFWDNKSNDVIGQQGGAYQGYAYAIFNTVSGEGIKAPGSTTITSSDKKPNQYVKVSQGFLVKAVSNSPKLIFRNSQRDTAAAESGFFGKEA
ncbi:GEVED domain-containing protein, partial [Kaistella sp.]|uniref:GEVED domain-containing protein n=1 Tax=Kaistella sp. TaxID=2782235 RepID=UPI002F95C903